MSHEKRVQLLGLLLDHKDHSTAEITALIPDANVTRRVRELRSAEHGGFAIGYTPKRGYYFVGAGLSDETADRRRQYMMAEAHKLTNEDVS